jgi:PAS domain S-box-containing protein
MTPERMDKPRNWSKREIRKYAYASFAANLIVLLLVVGFTEWQYRNIETSRNKLQGFHVATINAASGLLHEIDRISQLVLDHDSNAFQTEPENLDGTFFIDHPELNASLYLGETGLSKIVAAQKKFPDGGHEALTDRIRNQFIGAAAILRSENKEISGVAGIQQKLDALELSLNQLLRLHDFEYQTELNALTSQNRQRVGTLTGIVAGFLILSYVAMWRIFGLAQKATDSLAESEQRYRNVVENQSELICRLLPDGTFTFANEAYCDLFGLTKEQLIGKKFRPNVPEEDKSLLYNHLTSLDPDDPADTSEHRIILPSGEVRWYSWTNQAIISSDEHVVEIQGTGRDITDRVYAEQELVKNEERMRLLIENSPFCIHEIDVRGCFLSMNSAGLQMMEESNEDDIIGQPYIDVVGDSDGPLISRLMSQARTGNASEFEFVGKNGKTYSSSFIPIRDKDETVLRIMGLTQDITERKRKEEEIQHLNLAVENAMEGISRLDIDGRFIMVKDQYAGLCGYSPEELIGETWEKTVSPKGLDAAQEAFDRMVADGRGEAECEGLRKDGTTFEKHILLVESLDEKGNRDGHYCFMRDISQAVATRKENEELMSDLAQAQKLDSIGRLAGGVAHDFNNMLSVILGSAELLELELPESESSHTYVMEITHAAERSADLTRQLLAFARKQPVQPVEVDLNQSVEENLKMLRRLIGEEIELTWLPGENTWPIKIDLSQLNQILTNLCINSRDALDGIGSIHISTANFHGRRPQNGAKASPEPSDFVQLSVHDNGPGISPENLGQLFEPFFTTKEKEKGTGLGLATVYGIVKQNNGHIEVDSPEGKGTTFNLFFPRCTEPVERTLSSEKSSSRTSATVVFDRKTVLLVEDEPTLLQLTRSMLERLGFDVLTADDPFVAIQITNGFEQQIDLLLTDVIMPKMDGAELAQKLKADRKQLKCLYMSGYAPDSVRLKNMLLPGKNFLQKPFTIQQLSESLLLTLEN